MAKKKQKKFDTEVRISRPNPTWTTAILIVVSRHRDRAGNLVFEESIFERSWKIPDSYKRVWSQNRLDEPYQIRIKALLEQGHVVLKAN